MTPTPPEKHLFDLLKRGYVDARYKDHYEITTEELTTLIGRITKLQAIAEKLCKEKIASLGELVGTHNLRKAQYMAGHRYVSSTEDYKQQVLDELQSDVKKFHPL